LDPFIDPKQVTVKVIDREATLSSEVATRAAFDVAADIALAAGARKVHNRLIVRNVTDSL
jgi:osmotically-inducible protein OsmY